MVCHVSHNMHSIFFFWKINWLFTILASMNIFDLSVCCDWSFNASDAAGGGGIHILRGGENTARTDVHSRLLELLHFSPFASALHPAQLKNRLFKQICSWPWTLNTFGQNLNIEGNLERTEAALRGPLLHSLCVVLMSTFVPTVAFQIHANRRPVLCAARYRWSPLWTL